MTRLALLAALSLGLPNSQALAAIEQVKPETRIQPEKPIDAQLDTDACSQVVIVPWVLIGPDGEVIDLGGVMVRREC